MPTLIIRKVALVVTTLFVGIYHCVAQGVPEQAKWFDTSVIHETHIDISDDNWELLREDPHALKSKGVKATFSFDGIKLASPIRFNYKGHSTFTSCWDNAAAQPVCAKLPMTVRLDAYNSSQKIYGLTKMDFNPMNMDPTLMHERLSYEIAADFGIITARASYTKVYMNYPPSNQEYQGIFMVVEQMDSKPFLKDRFKNIYDNVDMSSYKNALPIGGKKWASYYNDSYETGNDNKLEFDHSTMMGFGDLLAQAERYLPDPRFAAQPNHPLVKLVDSWMSLEYLRRFLVVQYALLHWDNVLAVLGSRRHPSTLNCPGGCIGQNYVLAVQHARPKKGYPNAHIYLMPYDYDGALSSPSVYPAQWWEWRDNTCVSSTITDQQLAQATSSGDGQPGGAKADTGGIFDDAFVNNAGGPLGGFGQLTDKQAGCMPMFRAALLASGGYAGLAKTIRQLLQTAFDEQTLLLRVDEIEQQLAPALIDDPAVDLDAHEQAVATLKSIISLQARRLELAATLLETNECATNNGGCKSPSPFCFDLGGGFFCSPTPVVNNCATNNGGCSNNPQLNLSCVFQTLQKEDGSWLQASACVPAGTKAPNLIAIMHSAENGGSAAGSSVSTTQKAAIGVAAAALIIAIAWGAICCARKQKSQWGEAPTGYTPGQQPQQYVPQSYQVENRY